MDTFNLIMTKDRKLITDTVRPTIKVITTYKPIRFNMNRSYDLTIEQLTSRYDTPSRNMFQIEEEIVL